KLRWFDTKPLFGKRVLVTRAREQASALSDLLREQGAEPIEFPAIRIEPLQDYSELDEAINGLARYDWIIFTSVNTVKVVEYRLQTLNLDSRVFGRSKIAAIGPATSEALRALGLRADFVPTKFVAESIVEEWPERNMDGSPVLIPRAKEARDFL